MKTTLNFKKVLLISSAIVALGASTAFASTGNSHMNNKYNDNSKNHKQMQKAPKALYHNSKISPVQTLAKILKEYPQKIQKDAHKDFSDVYQYAQKRGVLNKYKAERIMLAKDNIQRAVDQKKINKDLGNKVLKKVQYNINHEKPESMGIAPEHKGHGNDGHGPRGMRMHNQDFQQSGK